jgi:3-oxocholest-4-en-26-oyl-CoA dehydrogenase beta subunit
MSTCWRASASIIDSGLDPSGTGGTLLDCETRTRFNAPVDFTFDEVQEDLRGLAATIIGEQVTAERLKELEAGSDRIDRRLWDELAKANLLGIALRDDVGGSGYGLMEAAVVLQEIGRKVAPVPALATLALGAPAVDRFGTEAQRRALLPGVVDGTTFLTAALDEPANHDPLAPATTAVQDGGGWRLDGVKVGVPWATLADRILVSAGEGVFLVDPSDPGVTLEPAEATHREPQGTLTLAGATGDRLGGPGDEVIGFVYRHGVAGICATAVGLFEEAVRITASYISEREQFGKPIATFQGATLRAADAFIDSRAISVATWSAVWRLATGRDSDDALAIAKFWVADGGQRIAHACQHLHGGMGVDVDYPIHRYFLWAKELELALGGATPQLLRLGASMAAAGAA